RRLLVVTAIVLFDVGPQCFNARAGFRFPHVLTIRMRIRQTMARPFVIQTEIEGPQRKLKAKRNRMPRLRTT
ncbi:MAG TPA: hypothetical protein VIH43_02650, partial [Chthoniobacterales bacterium]